MKTIFRDYIECLEAKKMVEEFNLIRKANKVYKETGEWILTEEEEENTETGNGYCLCEDCRRTAHNILIFEMYYPNIKYGTYIKHLIKWFDIVAKHKTVASHIK